MPPITMPATGMTPAPLNGTTPEASDSTSTGSAPAATAAPTHTTCRRSTSSRRADVSVATTYISPTKASDHHTDASAAAMTSETTASCSTARTAAVTWSRPAPSRPTYDAATASPTSATSTRASRRSGSGVEVVARSSTPRACHVQAGSRSLRRDESGVLPAGNDQKQPGMSAGVTRSRPAPTPVRRGSGAAGRGSTACRSSPRRGRPGSGRGDDGATRRCRRGSAARRPSSTATGMTSRLRPETRERAACGATSPMKPTAPTAETAVEASSAAPSRATSRTGSRRTPISRGVSSSTESRSSSRWAAQASGSATARATRPRAAPGPTCGRRSSPRAR